MDCLLYRGQNGLISKIASQAKLYLQNNKSLAKVVFNTIIMLAEDEMQHQVYNANYVKNSGKEPNFEFHPNKQLKLSGVDHWIKQENALPYVSKYDEIIENYLFNEKEREEIKYSFMPFIQISQRYSLRVPLISLSLSEIAINCSITFS